MSDPIYNDENYSAEIKCLKAERGDLRKALSGILGCIATQPKHVPISPTIENIYAIAIRALGIPDGLVKSERLEQVREDGWYWWKANHSEEWIPVFCNEKGVHIPGPQENQLLKLEFVNPDSGSGEFVGPINEP